MGSLRADIGGKDRLLNIELGGEPVERPSLVVDLKDAATDSPPIYSDGVPP